MDSASADSLLRYWISLPEELKAKLRLGFTGKRHLLDIAGWCLRSGNPEYSSIAADALETAVRESPLDGEMALELLSLEPARSLLAQPTCDRLMGLAESWKVPDNIAEYRSLQTTRDFPAIKEFIRTSLADQPGNLFWAEQAMSAGCVDCDAVFFVESVECGVFSGAEDLIQLACGRVDALFSVETAHFPGAVLSEVRRSPWNMTVALRAYDQLQGVAERREQIPGSVAVLLYSWNKAEELEATLESLAASDLAGASVFVLDNGSTDDTAVILRRWEPRFESLLGADRFTTIFLPVNVGAAAARNWLLNMEPVQAHEFVCYLDDDVELPADWLARLGTAVAEYPEAGVWGCKVVDHFNPLLIQSADSHLLVDHSEPFDLTKVAPNPFKLSDLHIQVLDTGAFNFLRPCASVTGCCHLFRTQTLLDTGGFAIQLSPSQYDDMEHDLRLCEAGRFSVYQGHLAIRHKKRTGAASRTSMQEEGNAIGNKYKMQTMHTPEEIAAASHAEQKLLDEDILRKLAFIERA